jgi:hypothetical protein
VGSRVRSMVLKKFSDIILTGTFKRGGCVFLCACYLALVCFHLIMAFYMKGPRPMADELGYLGNARILVGRGVAPNMTGAVFYHAGYSLLISPAFLLSSDPERVYFFVSVLNSFLISSLFLFLYYWLHHILLLDQKISLFASWITSLYPSFLLHSNTAWSENAIIPLFLVPSILLYLTVKRKSLFVGIAFGLSVSFLYTVHPRILPLLPITVLYLVFLGFLKFLPPRIVAASLSSLGIGLFATLQLHHYLRFLGWAGGGIPSASRILSRAAFEFGVGQLLLGAAGQVWYLTASTYGLFLTGCFILGLTIWRNLPSIRRENSISAEMHALLFYGFSSAGVFVLSVLFLSNFRNAGHAIYGRYNECFVAVFMALALGTILAGRFSEKWIKLSIAIGLIGLPGLGLFASLIKINPIDIYSVIPENVHGLFPILGTLVYKLKFSFASAVWVSTLFFLLAILFLTWAFKVGRFFGIFPLCSLFLITAVSQYVVLYHPGKGESLNLPKAVRSVPGAGTISFDLDSGKPGELYRYQYLLPFTRFLFFNSSKSELPETDVFITSRFSERFRDSGARLLTVEKEGDLGLWVKLGSPTNQRILKGGP